VLRTGRSFRTTDRVGIGLVGIGIVTIIAIALHPASGRSLAESGALAVALGFGRALPLIGLGVAAGLSRDREAVACGILFAIGFTAGFVEKDDMLSALAGPGETYRVFLVDPLASLTMGLGLAIPGAFRRYALPFVALIVGCLFALSMKLNSPDPTSAMFPTGGAAVAAWLLATSALFSRQRTARWLQIAFRIFGSWLIAIGLLLGGAAVVQRSAVDSAAPSLPPPTVPWNPDNNGLKNHRPNGLGPSVGP